MDLTNWSFKSKTNTRVSLMKNENTLYIQVTTIAKNDELDQYSDYTIIRQFSNCAYVKIEIGFLQETFAHIMAFMICQTKDQLYGIRNKKIIEFGIRFNSKK